MFGDLTLCAALIGVACPVAAQDTPPTVLGTLGGTSAEATAINDVGAIIGTAQNRDSNGRVRERRATWYGFYKPPGRPLVQVDFDQTHTDPRALNARGEVVATLKASNSQSYASIVWRSGTGGRALSVPSGHLRAVVTDIDDAGNVLFTAAREAGGRDSYLYRISTGETAPLACDDCSAVAMNEAGDIVADSLEGPLLIAEGTAPIALPGDPAFSSLQVVDINERGTILGTGYDAAGDSHVVFWSGARHTLRVLGEGIGFALNDRDVAAGGCFDAGTARRHACLFDLANARVVDLPDLTADDDSSVAVDINNSGVAVGTIYRQNEGSDAVAWAAYAPRSSGSSARPGGGSRGPTIGGPAIGGPRGDSGPTIGGGRDTCSGRDCSSPGIRRQ